MTQTRSRSRAYPYLDLASAVDCLRDAYPDGCGERAGRDELAVRLGYTAGSGGVAARKIASLVHYGFVESHSGSGSYSLSVRGRTLLELDPRSQEFRESMQAALCQPRLFDEVLTRYRSDGRLPDDLATVLEEEHGITAQASARAARVLRASARFAGLLDGEGRLRAVEPGRGDGEGGADREAPEGATAGRRRATTEVGPETRERDILLARRRRAAFELRYPPDVDGEELDLIEARVCRELADLRRYLGLEGGDAQEDEASGRSASQPAPGIRGVVRSERE